MVNVLIFPAGETNAIELHDSLSNEVNINVFGASSVNRHGEYVFEKYRGDLPFVNDEKFFSAFNNLLHEWNIDFIFPTHDDIVEIFAANKSKINATVICPELHTAQICRDKMKTYELFNGYDFCPTVYKENIQFPCFIKPRKGQGAVGAKVLKCKDDKPKDIDDYILTEYLPGREYTVDCITDKYGKLIGVFPRIRIRTMAGVCVSGENCILTEEIYNIANVVNEKLNLKGLWYFQLKEDIHGRLKLLEVSARCSGTMCLTRARGVNLPLLSVYIFMGKVVDVFCNEYSVKMDRALIARYKIDYNYDTVYIDYDDTLIIGNKVCLDVIRFIYQCNNEGKKVVLLSKHATDHRDSLKENMALYGISEMLFSNIIDVGIDEEKADYIYEEKAIFVDNAYNERKKIHKIKGIPVFDVEGVQVLFDWKK